MKREVFIYLDGNNATLTDGIYMKWNIPEYYYKNINDRDDIYISLEHAQFLGTATLPTKHMANAEVLLSTNIRDYTNTKSGNENVIGMFDCVIDAPNTVVYNTNENYLKSSLFKVGKFTDLTILVRIQELFLDFSYDANGINVNNCKFLLKMTYVNNDELKAFKSVSQPGSYYNATEKL